MNQDIINEIIKTKNEIQKLNKSIDDIYDQLIKNLKSRISIDKDTESFIFDYCYNDTDYILKIIENKINSE